MPNTREKEKLTNIVCEAMEDGCIGHCNYPPCFRVECVVNALIANGVTVQELDGCEYCKEDGEGHRTMFGAFSITNPFHGNEWFVGTGHCKPRQIYFCPMCGREFPKKG